uniref:Tuliposide A-converting enzyme b3, amyloplastic n=1 Tax=Tulipa gesneriana TaxID=13306 RepID=TCAB3_TULGE|nr:RecName: Full=Tuliposide A-converting enzyme b3, amyloplastic; Short=TgTCEA-b3; Flags: Precursor [Tulipa gesneriana]BAN28567.1 tuliposide A-converting enzyme [Tulipa gesneriana]
MSAALFCGPPPAVSFGCKDGRGRKGMVRSKDIVRQTVKPPAHACRLIGWNKYPGSVVPTNSSLSPSPTALDDDIELDLSPFLIIYKDGRIERLKGTTVIPACPEVATKDVIIDPATGVSVRLYLPNVVDLPSKKLPVLVYFHGGGFVIENTGSPNYHNYLTLLAAKSGLLIVSVNYRLAPEHPIPASFDDCMAGFNWVVSHSAGPAPEPWLARHGDLTQILISGDSAGGTVTHYVLLRADAGVIEGAALVHPYFLGSKRLENQTEEDFEFHEKLWRLSTPNTEGLDDPLINPLAPGAPSLAGLKCKRAVVFVAELDFLVERGRMYYDALVKSGWGGEAELVHQEGVGHVFHLSDYSGDVSVDMMAKMVAFLRGE